MKEDRNRKVEKLSSCIINILNNKKLDFDAFFGVNVFFLSILIKKFVNSKYLINYYLYIILFHLEKSPQSKE